MSKMIAGVEQVTPEWLSGILVENGYSSLGSGFSVKAVSRLQHTSTWFADISFLKVTYSGRVPESAPERLFLKISKPGLTPADLAYGRKEVEFYTTVAKAMENPPLPRCYDAVYAPDTGRSHLLLDDLSETHFQPLHPLPPSEPDCERAMEYLARFHAHWWEHPRLGTDIGNLANGKTSNAANLGLPYSLRETEQMLSGFVDMMGDRLTVPRRKIYEGVLSAWPFSRLSERLRERRAITIVHGDAHAWNYLYPHDPARDGVCLIDWQEWGIGLGTVDLAEMMVLWWWPERRARLEEALLRRYHRQLVARGVEGYDWEQCWNDYRLSAMRILLSPIWMHAEGRSPAFWWPILQRSLLAFQDLGCGDLLV